MAIERVKGLGRPTSMPESKLKRSFARLIIKMITLSSIGKTLAEFWDLFSVVWH